MVSNRGHALLLESLPQVGDKPVVTVEAYTKWYGLQVVTPGYAGRAVSVEEVPVPESTLFLNFGLRHIDHAPNPAIVLEWCERMDYEIEEMALEMILGRWSVVCGDSRVSRSAVIRGMQ